jgi:cephalosporin hydroxylase
LEIGTHYGGTTEVFVEYFNSYMSNGVLVTADIKRFKIFDDPTTIQVIVFPHSHDVISRHFVTQEELLGHSEDSVDVNTSILRGCLDELSQNAFDFAFVDGDHARDSVLKDLDIVKRLSTDPHYALLDDVKDDLHEVSTLWRETLTQHFEYYDFGDWPIFCGVGLLWGY